jgi:hypothetical protein
MEVQLIQARTQIRYVANPGKCEDCDEELRKEDALKKDIEEDQVNLSQASLLLSKSETSTSKTKSGEGEQESATGQSNQAGPKTDVELSEEERQILKELRARDAEVRAHEQAHLAAAGPYANGAPKFEYQTGPDGKQYAVGGEVSIDTSAVPGNPEATARKAQTIKRAALAPRDPSPQDIKVAAQAAQLEAQARLEVKAEKAEEKEEAAETENVASAPEEGQESGSPLKSNDDSGSSNPLAQRVAKRFSPSSGTSGNLLNVIS